jgi:hypothetical protein
VGAKTFEGEFFTPFSKQVAETYRCNKRIAQGPLNHDSTDTNDYPLSQFLIAYFIAYFIP